MMGSGSGMGSGIFFGLLLMVGLILIVVVLVWAIVGGLRRRGDAAGRRSHPGNGAEPTPTQVLDERYARGELSTEEYQERLRVLGHSA